MKCEQARCRLSAFQDGELEPGCARELELHLRDCAACRAELRALDGLLDGLRRLTPVAAAPGFSARVMAALQPRPRTRPGLLPSLGYALALLAVSVAGFLLQVSANMAPVVAAPPATTFGAVLSESRELGLLAVHDRTLKMLGDLKQISLTKEQHGGGREN
jgi:anti-sigma factor RsiW